MKITREKKELLRFIFNISIPFILRDFNKLESIARKHIQNEKKITDIYHEILAYALRKKQDYDNCIKEYVLVITHYPDNVYTHYRLIKLLYKTNKYKESLQNSELFFSINFKKVDKFILYNIRKNIYWYGGYSAYQLKKYSKTSKYLEKYIKFKKVKNIERHFEIIGYAYLMQHEYDKSKYYFEEALKINPSSDYAIKILNYIVSIKETS